MAYLTQRLLLFVLVLWGISVTVFLALQFAPGSPAQILLGPLATKESLERLTRELGLDQPMLVQYAKWFGAAITGDFGTSIQYKASVSSLIGERLLNSLILAAPSFILATVLGLSIGIVSALYTKSWVDATANTLMFVGLAVPVFWLGLVLILIFGLQLSWFPVSGMHSPGSQRTIAEVARHLVLPTLALAIAPAAVIAQIARATLLDEIKRDYVRTGVAKGLGRRTAVLRHALRNTWIPVVTALGLEINYVIGGAVLVENVFNWPGVGQLLVQGAINRDYPVVMGLSLILSAIFVAVNFAVEAVYVLIDPRLRTSG